MTDDGARSLCELDHLTHLTVADTAITDRGIERIGMLKHLKSLSLSATDITIPLYPSWHSLADSRNWDISETKITELGLAVFD